MTARHSLLALLPLAFAALTACTPVDPAVQRAASADPGSVVRVSPQTVAMYGAVQDGGFTIPAIPPKYLSEEKKRQFVDYWSDEAPGTIVVDPYGKYLYLVQGGNKALRYAIAVGEAGRGFSGTARIPVKKEWPHWTPTQNMIQREPEKYADVADGMEGGLDNPLGARALYLYRNGRDTLYRIHGTPYPWSIGHAVSSGCIRLFNQDILDLYERVNTGTKVVVLTESEAGKGTIPPSQRQNTGMEIASVTTY